MQTIEPEREITAIRFTPKESFVSTPYVKDLAERSIRYLKAGYPLHLRGPAGTGKTTLAMHIAAFFQAPTIVFYGNNDYDTSDLIGSESGYRREKVVDNFIHSVLKTVDNYQKRWVDNHLTIACKRGYTLIYDEFTRSKPETNNILLSILEERVLKTNNSADDSRYIKVHPNFKAIFTSNKQEYAGVHAMQDALFDRMITIDMNYMDLETEREIIRSKANIEYEDADRICRLIRSLRDLGMCESMPSLRTGIMLGTMLKRNQSHAILQDVFFRKTVYDCMASKIRSDKTALSDIKSQRESILDEIMQKTCNE